MPNTIASADSFNTLQNSISSLYGNTYDAAGQAVSTAVTSGQLIRASDWNRLLADTNRADVHQSNQTTSISPATIGSAVSTSMYTILTTEIGNRITYYLNAHPSQIATVNTPISFTTSTTTTYTVDFNWSSNALANGFFNLGGSLTTDLVTGLSFSATNYNPTISHTVGPITGPTTDNLGHQSVSITGYGSGFAITTTVTPNTPGVNTTISGNAIYKTSISPNNAGIFAVAPSLGVGLTVSSVVLQTLTGNTANTAVLTLTNNGNSNITISSINYINDPTKSYNITFTSSLGTATLAPNASTTLTLTWQNNNLGASGGLYNNIIDIVTNIGTIQVVNPVQANFGIGFFVGGTPITSLSELITTSQNINLAVGLYGGVVNPNYYIDASWSNLGSLSLGTSFPYYSTNYAANPLVMVINIDTSQSGNGTYTPTLTLTVNYLDPDATQIAVGSLPCTFNVNVPVDHNIGSWISAENNYNGLIAFSYDMINGQTYLTYGFGWGGGGTNQVYQYDQNVLQSLTPVTQLRSPNLNEQWSLYYAGPGGGPGAGNWSTFLKTYGVWFSDVRLTGTYSQYYSPFVVRNADTFTWEFSCDNIGSFSLDRTVIATQTDSNGWNTSLTGTISLSAGIHSPSWTVTNQAGPGAAAIKITDSQGNIVWSTLYALNHTWAEIGRVKVTGAQPNLDIPVPPSLSYPIAAGQSYSNYFSGQYIAHFSSDGYGNLTVGVNPSLSTTSGDNIVDTTLTSVQYLMYYYSNDPNRITQIGPSGPTTQYFIGFDASGNPTTITATPPN